MKRVWSAGVVSVASAFVLVLGVTLVHASLAASDSDDHYKPAKTGITGTAVATAAETEACTVNNVAPPPGTVTCFSVPGESPTITVYCTHSTSGGTTPATGLGLFAVKPSPVFNDGYNKNGTPKPCTDSLGGTETTKISGTWEIGGIDAANDESSGEPNSGDGIKVVVPKAGAVVITSQGCQITIAPNGPYTATGAYDDHSKFTVALTNVPVTVSKLKAGCPLPAGVPLKSTFKAIYVFVPGVSDAS